MYLLCCIRIRPKLKTSKGLRKGKGIGMAVVMVNVIIHIYENLILDIKDFSMYFYQFIYLTQQRIDLYPN